MNIVLYHEFGQRSDPLEPKKDHTYFVKEPGLIEAWMKKAGFDKRQSDMKLGTSAWLPQINLKTTSELRQGLGFLKKHKVGFSDEDIDAFGQDLNRPNDGLISAIRNSQRLETPHIRVENFVRQILKPVELVKVPRLKVSFLDFEEDPFEIRGLFR